MRRGMVLIITLWVLTILAVLALTFAATMHVESRACHNEMQRVRARYAAYAGINRAIVAIQADQTGYVSELSEWAYLDSDDEEELRFPDDEHYEVIVRDECGKLDMGSSDQELLEKLPQLTPELIDCILDWTDADDDTRRDGAEADFYARLMPPRACANRPLFTLEELLMVNGVTEQVLYGSRALRPQAVSATLEQGSTDEVLPLEDIFTVYGGMNDLSAQGQDRVNINTADEEELSGISQEILSEGDIRAIIRRRDTRPYDSIGGLLQVQGMTREKLQQLADLITTKSQPEAGDEQGEPGEEDEPPEDEQPGIEDLIPNQPQIPGMGGGGMPDMTRALNDTVQQVPGMPGMPGMPGQGEIQVEVEIETEEEDEPQPGGAGETEDLPAPSEYRLGGYNINTAPAEVLMTVEGMSEELVQEIVEQRRSQPFTTRGDLLNLSEVSDEAFAQVAEEVDVRSSALKITALGSVEGGRVRARVTVILDMKDSEPQIVYIREG